MILSHIVNRLNSPMLITPSYHRILMDVVKRHMDQPMVEPDTANMVEDDSNEPYDILPGVRVIPICGPIGYRVSALEKVCGIADVSEISDNLDMAMNDDTVETIVFDINSPGGEVKGVPELANKIINVGKKKNCIAYTDTQACSAAQYLAAACNEVYATPTAELGSIGVYCALYDVSEAYKMEGVKAELFTSGDLKAIGVEGTSLTDKQRQFLQESVNKMGMQFRTYMKDRIPNIKDEDMQGQSLSGEEMYNKGYITALVSSIYDIFPK